MSRVIDIQSSNDIWHLSIEDLLTSPAQVESAAGTGPFVLNLRTSTSAIGAPPQGLLRAAGRRRIYQLVGARDEGPLFRLRLGLFESEAEAEALLETVREYYPAAAKEIAEDGDKAAAAEAMVAASRRSSLRANEPRIPPRTRSVAGNSLTAATAAEPGAAAMVAAPPQSTSVSDGAAFQWDLNELLPHLGQPARNAPRPALAQAARPEAPTLRAATEVAMQTRPMTVGPAAPTTDVEVIELDAIRLDEIKVEVIEFARHGAAPIPATQPAAPPQPLASDPMTIEVTLESAAAPPEMATSDLAADAGVATVTQPEPSVETLAMSLEEQGREQTIAAAVEPTAALPKVAPTARLEAEPVSCVAAPFAEPAAAISAPPAISETPPVLIARPAIKAPPAPQPTSRRVVPQIGTRPVVAAQLAPPRQTQPPDHGAIPNIPDPLVQAGRPELDSTQTLRPLTALELAANDGSQWFAIQLTRTSEPIDADQVPNLGIFEEYRLYSVTGLENDQVMHALRVGFFSSELAAQAVARYLQSFFDAPIVKRVSIAERERFGAAQIVARKDVGESGRHAAIELVAPAPLPDRRVETPQSEEEWSTPEATAERTKRAPPDAGIWSRFLGARNR